MRLSAVWIATALTFNEQKQDAVTRVIGLLEKMKETLEKEKGEDQKMYEELKCWCETNDKEKRAALSANNAHASELMAEIEERAARNAELTTQIAKLKDDVAKNTEALATAEALREKEHNSFTDEEKEMIGAVTNLKNAITVLAKHHSGLLQMTPELKQSLASILHDAAEKRMFREAEKTNKKQAAFITIAQGQGVEAQQRYLLAAMDGQVPIEVQTSFASRIVASFAQQPFQSYAPRSGEIFGILNSMLENFEQNLTEAQKAEIKAQEEFLQLKTTKNAEIDAANKQLAQKKQQQADNSKALADAKDDLVGTRDDLRADTEFLQNLTLQCQDIDHQMAERTKTRAEEISAVAEAIEILSEDDARDLTRRTVDFLQVDNRRSRAAAVLLKAVPVDELESIWAGRQNRPKMAALASQVKLLDFSRVFEAMDKMVTDLKAQQAEEVKQKDWCNDEFNANRRATTKATHLEEDQSNTIEELENRVATLSEEIAAAQKEISQMQVEIKRSGEDRESENKLFQETINDQRATQAVLTKALNRLKQFYDKKTSLVQQTPPKQFAAYKNNAGSSPVLSMIEKIVDESKSMEKEAMAGEQDSQTNYETFVRDANNSITNLQISIANKERVVAATKEQHLGFMQDRDATRAELENFASYKGDLHQSCDFLLKNFDVRQEARAQEMEAIGAAKAILSGAQ